MQMDQIAQAIWRLAIAGIDQLHYLVVRFGIANLPADILLNCDDIVNAALSLSA